jgi:3-hydroxyacyl-CoA dehydrogenase/enoyl-CoA hydratase/3-hydroxybutyryl-CoA epimerase
MNKNNIVKSQSKNASLHEKLTIGVLGSGLMGHGIAFVSALYRHNVVMLDTSKKKAEEGLENIKKILSKGIKNGFYDVQKSKIILSKILPTSSYRHLKSCDLIIEAVFEDFHTKKQVTLEAHKRMKPDAIFASNTSTLPITELAKNSLRPEKFLGIHFFSPVHRMELVEIIKGNSTSEETLSKARNYVKSIRKTPIIVNDGKGFYTTRVFERYTCEGMALLYEGIDPKRIEDLSREAGYPIGPLAILDEINISLAAKIRKTLRTGSTLVDKPWDIVMKIMIKKLQRTGRSSNGGFYEYPKGKKKILWPEINKYFPLSTNQLSDNDIIDRLYFSQAIETIRCLEENIVKSIYEANIGSILGWGFPKKTGGILEFVNKYGLEKFFNQSKYLEKKYGKRFSPPKYLEEMIKNKKIFKD